MDTLRVKLKEGGSKSKWYAKDELSKKILRHLTKHDRNAIQTKIKRASRAKKEPQMIEVQNYLKKTYQMEPEEIEEILAKEECYIVTFFCSIAVREKSQAKKARELKKERTPSLISENSRSKPGRRKKFSPKAHLSQKTEVNGKRKTVDRSDMLNGSKESVIRLF